MTDEMIAGRYRTEGVLGGGSMGVVWKAHDTVLDRTVALKEMKVPDGVDTDEAVERFLTEARAAARLSHTNIVTVHDVLADGDRVLLAMELLEGPTLAQAIAAAGGGLPAGDVRAVMAQVASALAEAHAGGVVHRDLKPDNVFWLASGRVVVCDFGLAKIGAGRGTRVGTVMGTPGYLAPEQVRGENAGPPADVFAWGAVAYEMLCGRPAFGDPSEEQVTLIWRVVNEDPAPLDLPDDPDLARLVGWSLAKDPAERPPHAADVLAALGGQAAIPTAIVSRPSAPPRTSSAPPWTPVGSVPPRAPRSGPKPSLVIG
ncbi:MAG: serine/threonine-protein kinase, partial [Gemmatimonadales bacterium]